MTSKLSRDVLKTAVDAARLAGKLLRHSAGRVLARQIEKKSANNFVTEIDKRSERMIVDAILKKFPGHAILAEESGASRPAEITWIIDPIDGTSNFIHNFPAYSISIGISRRDGHSKHGRVFAGIVYDPAHDELFSAIEGGGARLNKKPIHVSRTKRLADSFCVTGVPFRGFNRFEPYLKSFENISLGTASIRRCGSAALDLAHTACGRFDGYWEMGLQPWDIAAGLLIVREAGGTVTDLWGKTRPVLETGDILATNGKIHEEMQNFTKVIPYGARQPR